MPVVCKLFKSLTNKPIFGSKWSSNVNESNVYMTIETDECALRRSPCIQCSLMNGLNVTNYITRLKKRPAIHCEWGNNTWNNDSTRYLSTIYVLFVVFVQFLYSVQQQQQQQRQQHRWKSIAVTVPIFFMSFVCAYSYSPSLSTLYRCYGHRPTDQTNQRKMKRNTQKNTQHQRYLYCMRWLYGSMLVNVCARTFLHYLYVIYRCLLYC